MKTLTTPKGGQVRVSDEVAVILVPLGYREPVVNESPAPKPTPKKAPAKRTPRKTTTKKEV